MSKQLDNKLEGHFNKVFEYEDTENLDKDRKMEKSNKHEDVLTPHPLFVEMDELDGAKWEEKARWIKYEENLVAERGDWGKPHVSSLTFRSLINLRQCIDAGTFMLDVAVKNFSSLVHKVVGTLIENGNIRENMKDIFLRVLLYHHNHVPSKDSNKFTISLMKDGQNEDGQKNGISLIAMENGSKNKKKSNEREGAIVLVGSIDGINEPIVTFVRLERPVPMPNTFEVSLPVRFVFILLTPHRNYDMDPYEIGRSFSTLMSNQDFAMVAYQVQEKYQMLKAINMFLDDSVVLPPGDWDRKHVIIKEILDTKERKKERDDMKNGIITVGDVLQKKEGEKQEGEQRRNPLDKTSVPFGGVIEDIKCRYKHYLSDIKDGLNPQCLAAIIFIYFACLSGGVAFGGLMAAKTENAIGISETLIISCVAGVFFSLFAGCPLIIIGSTGPVLLFDEALFNFSKSLLPGQFLYWRTWVGIWTFVISLVVSAFQGSTLVKYFNKFMTDIFASLVSLVFIFEAIKKLVKIFNKHPLIASTAYCHHYDTLPECYSDSTYKNVTEEGSSIISLMNHITNTTVSFNNEDEILYCEDSEILNKPQPNTALLSAILMFGTFFIAYFLRGFKNSQYLGKTARKTLGDFGVPLGIVIMVLLDYAAGDTFTEKLRVPNGLEVTDSSQRGWFISPTGSTMEGAEPLPVWAMFVAFLPAILIYMLLFIETSICELIMMDKTKEAKGAGLHLDLVILSLINMGCGLFGGPWICAATVRAVAHVSALQVTAPSGIPGVPAKVVGVRDQRVTFFVVSVLLGVSVALAPILKQVPFAVLFGVFLYMGVCGMNGIQFFDRLWLCFKPIKHHPSVTYTKKVKTWRMILFTVLQALGLGLLWAVKSTPAALAFPFFVVAMIPYRWALKFIFTKVELDALDGPKAGSSYDQDEEDEDDLYKAANSIPLKEPTQLGLHKAMLGMVNMTGVISNQPPRN